MITITSLFLLCAFIITIMHAARGWPLWVAVLLIEVLLALTYLPAGIIHR